MEEYIWLLHRKNDNGLAVAVTGSLMVHGLMIVLLATTQIFYPHTGENARLDAVWLYSALLRDQPQEPSPQDNIRSEAKEAVSLPPEEEDVPLPEEAEQETEPAQLLQEEPAIVVPVAPPQRAIPPVPAPLTVHREPPAKAETVRNEVPVREELRLIEEGKGVLRPPPMTAKQPKKATPAVKESTAAAAVLKNITTSSATPSEVARKEPSKTEQVQVAERPVPKAEPVLKPREVPLPRQENRHTIAAVSRQMAAAVKAPQPTPPARKESHSPVRATVKDTPTPTAPSRPALPPVRPAATSLPKSEAPVAAKAVARPEPLPSPKSAVATTGQKAVSPIPLPAKEVFEAPVTGDLKMEVFGKNRSIKGAKITVLFRDYPRSRRGKTMVKSEALRRRQIHPRLVRPAENTLQAVVEVAAEGVYEFKVESESGGAIEAEYVARIYEKTSKAKNKSLGTRTVGNKERITRVLMPEGIVWEDDTAFSGSMEDSDSITKFNSETGLVWKEYREE